MFASQIYHMVLGIDNENETAKDDLQVIKKRNYGQMRISILENYSRCTMKLYGVNLTIRFLSLF